MKWCILTVFLVSLILPITCTSSHEALIPLPSTILLYAQDGYAGQTIPVECCGDIEVDDSFNINSVKVAPGVQFHLFAEPSCSGVSLRSTINIPSIQQQHAPLYRHIRCLRILKLAPDSGIIIWHSASESGDGQHFFPGTYASHQLYWNEIGSVTIPDGYQVYLMNGSTSIYTTTQRDIHVTNIMSITVQVTCHSCVHGTCILPNTCDCMRGWDGDACDVQMIDTSSVLWCTYDEILIGESVPCAVWTRSRAITAVTTASSFTLHIEPQYGVITPTWSNNITSNFPFTYIPAPRALSTSSHPRQIMFTAMISSTHASLFTPTLAVFQIPDITSSITCTKTQLLQGESTTCYVTARHEGRIISTITRVWSVTCNNKGRVTPIISIKPPTTAVTPMEHGTKKKKRTSAWSDKVGEEFSFRYTALVAGNFAAHVNVSIIPCPTPPCHPISLPIPIVHHITPGPHDYLLHAKQSMFRLDIYDAIHYLTTALQQPIIIHIVETMILRCSIRILLGQWKNALRDYDLLEKYAIGKEMILTELDHDDDGVDRYHIQQQLLRVKQEDMSSLLHTIETQWKVIRHARGLQSAGTVSHAMQQWSSAMSSLSEVLEIAKFSDELHLLRAHVAIQMDNYMMVRHDISHVLSHTPHHDMALLLLSQASFRIIGALDVALQNLRYCNIMSSSSLCQNEYQMLHEIHEIDRIMKQAWQQQNYTHAITTIQFEMNLVMKYYRRVMTYGHITKGSTLSPSTSMGPYLLTLHQQSCLLHHIAHDTNTVSTCSLAIQNTLQYYAQEDHTSRYPSLLKLYIARGWGYLWDKRYDSALNDAKSANEIGWGDVSIQQLKDAINQAQEADKPRNFYEILGIALEATMAEIKRAYRKLALFYHPDKNPSPEAAAMFLSVQEAFSILSDETLRSRYDQGADMANWKKTQPPPEPPVFHHDGLTEDGRIRAWFMNEDGEQEWTEMDTEESRRKEETKQQQQQQQQQQQPQQESQKPMPKHCCLPWDG